MKKYYPRARRSFRLFGALTAFSLLVIGTAAAPGCGGSGGRSSVTAPTGATAPTSNGIGRATFTVNWPAPAPTRLIPSAANSIVVRITKPDGTALAEQRMERPAGGGPTTASFANLPVGDVVAQVSAYPNADGTGAAQASASATVIIQGGKTATLALSLASTIDRLEVTPSPLSLTVGESVTLAVAAKNSAGEIVLTDPAKITYKVTESTPAPAPPASIDSTGKVTANTSGAVTFLVTETESGKSTTLTVTVSRPNLPITQKSVTYQINAEHDGRAVFGQPLKFPSEPAWSVPFKTLQSPLIADGRVFALGVGANQIGTFAFDRATGKQLWASANGDSLAYDSGMVIVTGFTGAVPQIPTVYGLDAQTGAIRWKFEATPRTSSSNLPTPVLALNGRAIFSVNHVDADGSKVTSYCLDCRTGTVLWKKERSVASASAVAQTASLETGLVYLGDIRLFQAFDLATGSEVWQLSQKHSYSPPVYHQGSLYSQTVFSFASLPTILDARTGSLRGGYSIEPDYSPAFFDSTGIFVTSTGLKATNQTAQGPLWNVTMAKPAFPPILIDTTVLVTATDSSVTALEGATGRTLWTGQAAGSFLPGSTQAERVRNGMAAGEGYLVVPTGNYLTAWHLAGPE